MKLSSGTQKQKHKKHQNFRPGDFKAMLLSQKLILRGKRWRKFYQLMIYLSVLALVPVTGAVVRIIEISGVEWLSLLSITIPPLFSIWLFSYKNKELKFFELKTLPGIEENYKIAIDALRNLNWYINDDRPFFLEGFREKKIAVSWGRDMISILIDDNRILINCICNVDILENQVFFTFGRLKNNVEELADVVREKLNKKKNTITDNGRS